jgi:ABC-type spermidine/putrescine transport system permease subunit I
MAWLVIAFIVLLIIALAYGFVMNARMIKRDVNTTFEKFQARLESDANSVVDKLLEADHDAVHKRM